MPRLYAGFGELELAKELLGHLRVEMLPGVNDRLAHARVRRQCAANRRRLDELRPCPDDDNQMHETRRLATRSRGFAVRPLFLVQPQQLAGRIQQDLRAALVAQRRGRDIGCLAAGFHLLPVERP